MRISDWSSDVCSSDLVGEGAQARAVGVVCEGLDADLAGGHRAAVDLDGGLAQALRIWRLQHAADGVAEVVLTAAGAVAHLVGVALEEDQGRKSTRLNSSH